MNSLNRHILAACFALSMLCQVIAFCPVPFLPVSVLSSTSRFMTTEPPQQTATPNDANEITEPLPHNQTTLAALDPEVEALKKQIETLEEQLDLKYDRLSDLQDDIAKHSQDGYVRAFAEMETARRIHMEQRQDSKKLAMAQVLTDFLSAYDRINDLNQKYADHGFGKNMCKLSMKSVFDRVGVQQISVEPGNSIDRARMVIEETEFSDLANNTVVRVLEPGLQFGGNVIRRAKCVASKGAEVTAANETGLTTTNKTEVTAADETKK